MKIVRPQPNQLIPEHAKRVFKGVIFDVYQWEQEMFDGSVETFERLRRPDTVVVFPVLPDGRIILAEEEQPGKKPFVGATGGRMDEGEEPLTAARRELLEESGYVAETFTLWKAEQPVEKIDWTIFVFIAKGLEKSSAQDLDPGERIKLKPVTLDQLIDLAESNTFSEKEVVLDLIMAKYDPAKRLELEKLFNPEIR